MATCDSQEYAQLKESGVENKNSSLQHRRRIWAAFCGVLATGVVVVVYHTKARKEESSAVNLLNVMQGAQRMQMPVQKVGGVRPSFPFMQLPRASQPTQAVQTSHFRLPRMSSPIHATPEDTTVADVIDKVQEGAEKVVKEVETMAADLPAKKAVVLAALEASTDAAKRAALATALPALEAANPTEDPAFSDKLQGKWNVKYSGSVTPGPVDSPTREIALLMYAGGFGPGNAALSLANRLPDNLVQVKTVSLEVMGRPAGADGQSRATLALRLLDGQQETDIDLICELAAAGPNKLIEKGKEVRLNAGTLNMGTPVNIPEQVRYTRDLIVTYLDDEILVARDATGSPDILVREVDSSYQ